MNTSSRKSGDENTNLVSIMLNSFPTSEELLKMRWWEVKMVNDTLIKKHPDGSAYVRFVSDDHTASFSPDEWEYLWNNLDTVHDSIKRLNFWGMTISTFPHYISNCIDKTINDK